MALSVLVMDLLTQPVLYARTYSVPAPSQDIPYVQAFTANIFLAGIAVIIYMVGSLYPIEEKADHEKISKMSDIFIGLSLLVTSSMKADFLNRKGVTCAALETQARGMSPSYQEAMQGLISICRLYYASIVFGNIFQRNEIIN